METDEQGIITHGTHTIGISLSGYAWAKDQHTADIEAVKGVVNPYPETRGYEAQHQAFDVARFDILKALKAEGDVEKLIAKCEGSMTDNIVYIVVKDERIVAAVSVDSYDLREDLEEFKNHYPGVPILRVPGPIWLGEPWPRITTEEPTLRKAVKG